MKAGNLQNDVYQTLFRISQGDFVLYEKATDSFVQSVKPLTRGEKAEETSKLDESGRAESQQEETAG